MFQAVLFDLDGVITDTAEYHFLAWEKLAKKIGIEIDREFNENLKGVSREESLRRILEHGGKANDYTPEEFAAMAKLKNDNYVEMIQAVSPKDVYPGILQLLQDLRGQGIKIALASASKNGPFLLKQMQITEYFDAIADPAKVVASKPAPDIFIAAAEGVGVDVSQAIGIEDAYSGIAAIKAANVLPIGVGKAEVLGSDIALVSDTSQLTLDFLIEVWDNQ
ncbi:MAG: beta-phosphoglucomutase [Lactococcus chungangensis]|jgi:beta-phosphoglucomutase|uniref:Beta-phosphoglucomutase n=1 Tax=Pseudolactococcus chungangensis CAU 28 = DSM 22330 TaxID=1122154 RepID=A0A1K2H8J0_9LACT|nr:beta-phosphoglucomutase [Lactococcus chungangensis]MDD3016357.1 beta-phosphoglucomutase [Lactococcus chungangensis]NCB81481.1 beta-phosphoglucomutase [Bacilli bacterium]PCS03946.1 beta-phosphoglucomutase [Lactococcus chungangensis CAU 28 = DSM 22330]SFZ72946.1 beta-phosphoglucomutase [Lactococcus chungangensis CAU 28 = DSM 22330]